MKRLIMFSYLVVLCIIGLLTSCETTGSDSSSGTTQNKTVSNKIITQPAEKTPVVKGSSVVLSVAANQNCTYQWYHANSLTESGTAIVDATKETYTPPTTNCATTYYYCVAGDAVSQRAEVAVADIVCSPSELTERVASFKNDFSVIITDAENSDVVQDSVISSALKEKTNVSLDLSYSPKLTHIGKHAFFDAKKNQGLSLVFVRLPDEVTEIEDSAFHLCKVLEKVTFPRALEIIGNYAFCGCFKLDAVNLPDSVKQIKQSAFYGCNSLSGFVCPKSLLEIENEAFSSCEKLQSIEFSPQLEKIGERAFESCEGLTQLLLPKSLKDICDFAFLGCKNLKEVQFSESLETIGKSTFAGCTNLMQLTLPKNLKSIGNYAFSNCKKLEAVSFPENLEDIGEFAFSACSKLSNLTIPQNLKEIKRYTFKDCTNLLKVVFLDGVENISSYAFCNCSWLKNITFPETLKTIDDMAFYRCNFKELTLPKSVENIKMNAFDGCFELESLTINAQNPPKLEKLLPLDYIMENIYVPAGSVERYKTAEGWSTYASNISPIAQ